MINPKTKVSRKNLRHDRTEVAAGVPCFPHGLTLGPGRICCLGAVVTAPPERR